MKQKANCGNRDAYTEAKGNFIRACVKEARGRKEN